MGLKDDLILARARIEDPARWVQGGPGLVHGPKCCAVTACGIIDRMPLDPLGALGDRLNAAVDALDAAAIQLGHTDVVKNNGYSLRPAAHLNDTTDHATVLKMFDLAIKNAEAAS